MQIVYQKYKIEAQFHWQHCVYVIHPDFMSGQAIFLQENIGFKLFLSKFTI